VCDSRVTLRGGGETGKSPTGAGTVPQSRKRLRRRSYPLRRAKITRSSAGEAKMDTIRVRFPGAVGRRILTGTLWVLQMHNMDFKTHKIWIILGAETGYYAINREFRLLTYFRKTSSPIFQNF
jgi:hypothetical protein